MRSSDFSNILTKSAIEMLAQADEFEVIKEIQVSGTSLERVHRNLLTPGRTTQEYFADYLAHLPSLFTLSTPPMTASALRAGSSATIVPLYASSPHAFSPASFDLHVQGLLALLLSLKKKPTIRWERMSAMAKKLATEVSYTLQSGGSSYGDLFSFKGTSGTAPVLLILGQSHSLYHALSPPNSACSSLQIEGTIRSHRCSRSGLIKRWSTSSSASRTGAFASKRRLVQNSGYVCSSSQSRLFLVALTSTQQDVVLSPTADAFFANHMFANFGDLGASLASYVKDFQSRSLASNPKSIETVADMKRFVEEYPEFRKLGGNVSKHVALVGELSRIVERDGLLGISEVEQSLASNESHTADLKVRAP